MNVIEQLQTYTAQLVALGQATLALQRRGEWLPDELAAPAAALLALESELSATTTAAPAETAATPSEETQAPVATPGVTAILDEAVVAPPQPADMPDEPPTLSGGVALMSPIEADKWLSTFDEPSSTGLLIVPAAEMIPAAADEPLVIDVDEGSGGGPMTAGAATALPPLVIDPIHDLPTESGASSRPGAALPEGTSAAAGEPSPEPAAELRFCTNCGATLRPDRRFCHRCGASVAEMVAELFPAPPAPQPVDDRPAPRPTIPREEWPTIVSDSLPHLAAAGTPAAPAAMARFCNNCGLGLAADATVCPDCGSRDIS